MFTPSNLLKFPKNATFAICRNYFLKRMTHHFRFHFLIFKKAFKNGFDKISNFTFCHLGQKNFKKSKQIKNLKKTLDSDFC